LAALGLYSLLAYTVARRTREIGVRMALGATPRAITGMMLRRAATVVAVGIMIGGPVGFWGERMVAQMLNHFSVDARIAAALAGMEIALVALAAAYLPTRRAARVDPSVALRQD
jgi:putative ABC transport system permease protein